MDDRVRVRLVKAGWREGRLRPTDDIAGRPQQRGFMLFAAARAFLEHFGGLRVGGDSIPPDDLLGR